MSTSESQSETPETTSDAATTPAPEAVPAAPAPSSSNYAGSPYARGVYSGVADSVAKDRAMILDDDKRRARSLGIFVTVALLVGGLLGGTAGGAFAIWNLSSRGLVTPGVSSPATITVNAPLQASEITAVAAKAMPSVVTIEVAGDTGAGSGSGVVIDERGYVMTNAHVVSIGAQEPLVRVTMSDGRLFEAEVVGRDVLSDIAVIKIADEGPFTVMAMGDSNRLNVGDQTIAIGAPLGLPGTVTSGIVSAINRSITVGASQVPGEEDGQFDFDLPGGSPMVGTTISLPVIQTDASINPGNSGGALLNREGELIGVNVAIASTGGQGSGSIGLGFAIPANFAYRIATEIISGTGASHGLLGAMVTDAQSMATSTVTGAYIDSVTPGGAADAVGLRAGDIVTKFNGLPITNRIDLTAQVRTLPGGTTATMTYVRAGNSYTVEVTLGELE
ncbi:MAG: PDZ domain-containing protein [Microbacteriaceae bacterium]|nr:PDZ domain-containing protein [Microbacteriaceae bacterium]